MKKIILPMPAKINLSIDVLDKRADGYHSVEMIMQAIDLYDTISVEKQKEGITVRCSHPDVPEDQRNIAWRAAEQFFKRSSLNAGALISINKTIPVLAGLGGGSTDAAGVLKALNILYNNYFNEEQLNEISRSLGADVAFFLRGGTQKAEGIGNELTELDELKGVNLVLVKPDFSVSTPWVYQNLDLNNMGERPDNTAIINSIKLKDIKKLALSMKNVLESVTITKYPQINTIKEKLIEYGAYGSLMSGSGPVVFGVFPDEKTAKRAILELQKNYTQVYYNKTIGRGIY